MSWFQLDPQQVAKRIHASGRPAVVPSLSGALLRGMLGFTLVSLLGFAPWVLFGGWFYRNVGEAGLYAVCAVVFIAASGLLMHRLILGPGSLVRFYLVFTPAFVVYSVAWTLGWMVLKGHLGSVVGLLAGTALMGAMLVWTFSAWRELLKVIAALFLLNAVGYFVGGVLDGWIGAMESFPTPPATQRALAHACWAVAYGMGFGAGIGWAFYLCQTETRKQLTGDN